MSSTNNFGMSGFAQLAAWAYDATCSAVRREGTNHSAESLIGVSVSGNAFDTLGVSAYWDGYWKKSG